MENTACRKHIAGLWITQDIVSGAAHRPGAEPLCDVQIDDSPGRARNHDIGLREQNASFGTDLAGDFVRQTSRAIEIDVRDNHVTACVCKLAGDGCAHRTYALHGDAQARDFSLALRNTSTQARQKPLCDGVRKLASIGGDVSRALCYRGQIAFARAEIACSTKQATQLLDAPAETFERPFAIESRVLHHHRFASSSGQTRESALDGHRTREKRRVFERASCTRVASGADPARGRAERRVIDHDERTQSRGRIADDDAATRVLSGEGLE